MGLPKVEPKLLWPRGKSHSRSMLRLPVGGWQDRHMFAKQGHGWRDSMFPKRRQSPPRWVPPLCMGPISTPETVSKCIPVPLYCVEAQSN